MITLLQSDSLGAIENDPSIEQVGLSYLSRTGLHVLGFINAQRTSP
jgi:hypothetical protein